MTDKLVFGTKTMGISSISVVSVLARHSLGVGGSIRVHPCSSVVKILSYPWCVVTIIEPKRVNYPSDNAWFAISGLWAFDITNVQRRKWC